MSANFRLRLRKHLEETTRSSRGSVNIYGKLARARSIIQRALTQAKQELERYGYFLAVVRDTGSMISAKIFAPNTERDFSKAPAALTAEEGFRINLQLAADDQRGVMIYSHRHPHGSASIAQSMKMKDIEDSVYKEVEEQVKAAIEFWKNKKGAR